MAERRFVAQKAAQVVLRCGRLLTPVLGSHTGLQSKQEQFEYRRDAEMPFTKSRQLHSLMQVMVPDSLPRLAEYHVCLAGCRVQGHH